MQILLCFLTQQILDRDCLMAFKYHCFSNYVFIYNYLHWLHNLITYKHILSLKQDKDSI